MNIKKLLLISFLILTGCNNIKNSSSVSSTSASTYISSSIISSSSSNTSNSSSSNSSSSTKIESTSTYGDIQYNGYYKATQQSLSYRDVRYSYLFKDIPSSGDCKLLVVPVKFKDSTLAQTYGGDDNVKNDIEKVFFGEKEETGWESLKSFYKKSSYGQLNISGKVTDWFTLDMNFLEADSLPQETYIDPTVYIVREVGKWYAENYDDASEYDLNKDGYIDAIWMVYDWEAKNDYVIDWAHCYWDYINPEKGTIENPIPYTFGWASIQFMYEGGYLDEKGNPLVDSHTFIHETGHLLGLEDYYDYNHTHSYAGGLDMMDYNIGDHTSLSKYLLNWTNPYVVTDSCEITINSFTETGDMILVKDNWNHSSMDEYLLIEFYTPTGLNEIDSLNSYCNEYPLLYQNPGVKIYHIDARLGYYEYNRFKFFTDEIYGQNASINYSTQLAHSNTAIESADGYTPLIHLLENGGSTKLHGKNNYATDDTLFHEGDRFDSLDYYLCFEEEERFNDGEYINYLIDITSITDTQATIKFTAFN